MPDIQIVNCHVHTFTGLHTPKDYPSRWLRLFRKVPGLIRFAAWLARFFARYETADMLDRLYRFQQETDRPEQAELLASVARYYPSNTRFVVLPMDLAGIGYGDVPASLREQHDELNRLHIARPETVVPFATVNPLNPGSVDESLRALTELKFRGLKIYPRLGYPPDHPALMERVYPEVQALDLPVMSHCSRGGVRGKNVSHYTGDRLTEPEAYLPVMKAFPGLRICLAHFGGEMDWRAYAQGEPPRSGSNWQVKIRKMIGCGEWPGLWTDISYTLFHFDDYIPYLRLFLLADDEEGARLRDRVLFGSDFYMTRRQELSERDICFRLRNALGEEVFRKIAEENPVRWLEGDRPQDAT